MGIFLELVREELERGRKYYLDWMWALSRSVDEWVYLCYLGGTYPTEKEIEEYSKKEEVKSV